MKSNHAVIQSTLTWCLEVAVFGSDPKAVFGSDPGTLANTKRLADENWEVSWVSNRIPFGLARPQLPTPIHLHQPPISWIHGIHGIDWRIPLLEFTILKHPRWHLSEASYTFPTCQVRGHVGPCRVLDSALVRRLVGHVKPYMALGYVGNMK